MKAEEPQGHKDERMLTALARLPSGLLAYCGSIILFCECPIQQAVWYSWPSPSAPCDNQITLHTQMPPGVLQEEPFVKNHLQEIPSRQ